jgi:hypothetical protein
LHGGPPLRSPGRILLIAVAAIALAGAAGFVIGRLRRAEPVRVTNVPTPTAAETAACRKLSSLLPGTVGNGLKPRIVHPDSPLLHAWGTPAAVLRCGVGYPPNFLSAQGASNIDGVTWLSTNASDSVIFTAIDREPRVSVAIPQRYTPFDVLTSLSDALKKATTGS